MLFVRRIPLTNLMIPAVAFYGTGAVYIFLLWMLWSIAKSLKVVDASIKGIEASVKEIASSLQNKG
jgi:hypothetical protein